MAKHEPSSVSSSFVRRNTRHDDPFMQQDDSARRQELLLGILGKSDILDDDLETIAKKAIVGSGRDAFLRTLSKATSSSSSVNGVGQEEDDSRLDAMNKVSTAIRTGWIDAQRIDLAVPLEAGKIIVTVARRLAKDRFEALTKEGKELETDASFQEAMVMLSQCYTFGTGRSRSDDDDEVVKVIDSYIFNDKDPDNDGHSRVVVGDDSLFTRRAMDG